MSEPKFPDNIAFGSVCISEFSTEIASTKNGSEQRNSNWSRCRFRYNVLNGIKTPEELAAIKAFFIGQRGRALPFRFRDWSDYCGTGEVLGEGDGERTEFQLIKHYVSSGSDYSRKVTRPIPGTIKVYLDSEEIFGYDADLSSGILRFRLPPASGTKIKADFEFDILARFDSDILEITLDSINTGSIKEISVVEIDG